MIAFYGLMTCLGSQEPRQPLSEIEARVCGIRFCRFVESARIERRPLAEDRFRIVDVNRVDGVIGFRFVDQFVSVELKDGKIRGYQDLSPIQSHLTRLDRWKVSQLAQRYFEEAGFDDKLSIYSYRPESGATIDGQLQTHFLRLSRGIPVTEEFGVEFEFDQATGNLRSYSLPERSLPKPPDRLLPKCTIEKARVTMADYAFAKAPGVEELYEFRPFQLGIWRPGPAGAYQDYNLTPAQALTSTQGQGLLVYWGTFLDRSDERYFRNAFGVYIDAQSGRILAGWHNSRGERPTSMQGPFAWDIDVTNLKISNAFRSIEVRKSRIERSTVTPGDLESAKVMLQMGHMTFKCRYYFKSGLLGITRDRVTTYGTPDSVTLRALRQLLIPPSANR